MESPTWLDATLTTMRNLIVAVDPGGTTGFSFVEYDDETMELVSEPQGGQFEPQEFYEWLAPLTVSWGFLLHLVVERFTISNRTLKVSRAGSYDALEVIGVCRYLSKRDCGRDLEMSQPATVMNLFPDKWLKERGWYIPGKGHANDSLRHLAKACAKRHLIKIRVADSEES